LFKAVIIDAIINPPNLYLLGEGRNSKDYIVFRNIAFYCDKNYPVSL